MKPDTGFITIKIKAGDKVHMRTQGDTVGSLIKIIREELEEEEFSEEKTVITVTDKGTCKTEHAFIKIVTTCKFS